MKTLFVVRHARAKKESQSGEDFERLLTKSGRRDAAEAGHSLLIAGAIPQLILSSAAFRTISTAKIVADQIAYPSNLIITDMQLFDAGIEEWLHVIGDTSDVMNSLMIVGHNPAIGELYNMLSGMEEEEFPKAGIAVLDIKTNSWRNLKPGSASLRYFFRPSPKD